MIIKEKLTNEEFNEIAGDAMMIKMAVDIEKEILALGCELYVDCGDELFEARSTGLKVLVGAP